MKPELTCLQCGAQLPVESVEVAPGVVRFVFEGCACQCDVARLDDLSGRKEGGAMKPLTDADALRIFNSFPDAWDALAGDSTPPDVHPAQCDTADDATLEMGVSASNSTLSRPCPSSPAPRPQGEGQPPRLIG